ncbi:hypothetical protein HNR00_003112 [Methylorubrum rhodinum]|uniref:Uncharacterized protein n=1 Tax=Methylorubrum rhodinum TaxID=29428 RepID=A0A840ZJX3_9HYPH|nr:hypothetical protein [Methylorubrum rhodinum]MBB5758392.1 hypothetical protein [Methylorubrum rhodinum]
MSRPMLRKGRWRQLTFGPRPATPRASDVVLAVVATSLLAGLCLLAAANLAG